MTAARRVVVVGGGAAGTLTAVQLLRRGSSSLAVTVVEPRAVRGTAATCRRSRLRACPRIEEQVVG